MPASPDTSILLVVPTKLTGSGDKPSLSVSVITPDVGVPGVTIPGVTGKVYVVSSEAGIVIVLVFTPVT